MEENSDITQNMSVEMPSAQTPLLQLEGIRKEFPGTVALDGVEFELLPGEVHALIGENGAGKSTLIKIIAGIYQPDGGSIQINGETVELGGPLDALERGVKVVYQELDLAPNLSVAENVYLGNYPRTRFGTVDWKTLRDSTSQLLRELGLEIDPRIRIDELRVAEQQLVEIARALSRQAKIIIMDEPTSALSSAEVDKLFETIEQLKARGVGIMYVSHKLDEIYEIADRVTVFRDGKHIVTKPVKETQTHDLVTWMVGREIDDLYPKSDPQIGEILLTAENVTSPELNGSFDFEVRAGEVVAVYGLVGAGVHLLGRVLFGDEDREGTLKIDGQVVRPNSPRDAIRKGLGLLTENRKSDGLLMPLTVKENMTLVALRKFARYSLIQARTERAAARQFVEQLSIKTPSLNQQVRLLSGGNQQKTLLGRWMMQNLKVLILAEPTRGIDVGSKAEIYNLIDEMANQGMGLLVLSTELPEVLGIADRIIVVREGKVVGEFTREEATQEALLSLALVAV